MWTQPCGKLVSCAVSNLWIPPCMCRGTEWHKRFLQIRWHPRRGKAFETVWKMTRRRVLEGVILRFDVLKTFTWISGAPLEHRHCHLLHLSGDVKVVADCCKKWGVGGGSDGSIHHISPELFSRSIKSPYRQSENVKLSSKVLRPAEKCGAPDKD